MASMTNNVEFYSKKEISGFLFNKSDKVNTYTITQDDLLLAEKQPTIGVDDLAISMTNGLLAAIQSKQNTLPDKDCITLKQVTTLETLLADLAPKTSVYTQGETDNLLKNKNNTIVDDSLAISFTAGLADALGARVITTDNNDAMALKADQLTTYTKLETDAKITALVNSAPATLDTLKEIATALGNDANLAATLTTAIGNKANSTDVTSSLLLKADLSNTYTKEETNTKISAVVGLAPANLNTIKKVALAINNDDAFASTITTAIGKKANTTDMNTYLTGKTDKTLYDALVTAVGLKALATDVTSSLALKTDKTLYDALVTAVGLTALATDVTSSLALKTDKTLYDALVTAVGLKATLTDVNNALNTKANLASPTFTTKITTPKISSDGEQLFIKSGTKGITFQTHTWELPIITITDGGYMTLNGVLNADQGLDVPGVFSALVDPTGIGIVRIEYGTIIREGLEIGGNLSVLGNILGLTTAKITGLDDILTALATDITYKANNQNPQFTGNVGISINMGPMSNDEPASSSLVVAGARNVNTMIGCHLGFADESCYGMTFNVLNTACNSSIDFKYSTNDLISGKIDFDYSNNNLMFYLNSVEIMRITPTGVIIKKGISFQGVSGLAISDIAGLQTALNSNAGTSTVYTIAASDLKFATIESYNALVTAVGLKALATNVYTIAAADLKFATIESYNALVTSVGLKALATDVTTSLSNKCDRYNAKITGNASLQNTFINNPDTDQGAPVESALIVNGTKKLNNCVAGVHVGKYLNTTNYGMNIVCAGALGISHIDFSLAADSVYSNYARIAYEMASKSFGFYLNGNYALGITNVGTATNLMTNNNTIAFWLTKGTNPIQALELQTTLINAILPITAPNITVNQNLSVLGNIGVGAGVQDSELTFYSPHMAEIKFTTAGRASDAPLASIGCLYNPTAMAFNVDSEMMIGLTKTQMIVRKKLSVGNPLMNDKTATMDVDGTANITGNLTVGGTINLGGTVNLGNITTGNMRVFEDSSNALFKAGTMTHNYGLVFAICPVTSVPTDAQKLMTMDVETGVAINSSLSITNDLTVAGGIIQLSNSKNINTATDPDYITITGKVKCTAICSTAPLLYFGTYNTITPYTAGSFMKSAGGINSAGFFNETSMLFTVPYACVVKVTTKITYDKTINGDVDLWLSLNGGYLVQMLYMTATSNTYLSCSATHIISVTKNQTLQLRFKLASNIYSSSCLYEIL